MLIPPLQRRGDISINQGTGQLLCIAKVCGQRGEAEGAFYFFSDIIIALTMITFDAPNFDQVKVNPHSQKTSSNPNSSLQWGLNSLRDTASKLIMIRSAAPMRVSEWSD